MIYQLSTNIVIPGKMAQYFEIAEKAQPIYPKLGMKIVGSWHGYTGNMNAIYVLYAYDNLAALQKAREAQRTNVEWRTVMANVTALIMSQTNTLLEPNAWSPMK
jgi:hypothetical protein